jgi:hypothetical protein
MDGFFSRRICLKTGQYIWKNYRPWFIRIKLQIQIIEAIEKGQEIKYGSFHAELLLLAAPRRTPPNLWLK